MDPNANLNRQRQILAGLRQVEYDIEEAEQRGYGTDEEEEQHTVLLVELSELAEAMDEWLSRGGFPPAEWSSAPVPGRFDGIEFGDPEDAGRPEVPADFPVRPLRPGDPATDRVTCGTCGRSWDDAIGTEWTPAPSARCPFEYFH